MTIAVNTEQERVDVYKRAQDAVDGIFPDPLKVEPDEPRDIVKVNAIKPLVDATVNYLFGKPPEWQIPQEQDASLGDDAATPSDPTAAPATAKAAAKQLSPEEEWLEECLRLNRFPQFLLDLGYNGATCGTPYYSLDTDRRLPNPDKPAQPFPRFYVIDPAAMTIRTDPMDINTVIRYEWRYLSYDPATSRPVIERKVYTRADSGAKWIITRDRSFINTRLQGGPSLYGSTMLDAGWQPIGAPVDWLYSWPPIDHCKNLPAPNQVYGAPDVTDMLIDANNAINFNLSNRQRIDKLHGHPLLFFENFNGDVTQMDFSVGSVTGLPANGQTPVHVVQITPGVDSTATAALKAEIYNSMLEESATPSIILGDVTRAEGVPSGIALRMRMQPMLQKTETKRKLYEPFLVELIRRLFVLGGFEDDITVSMTWPELVPIDDLASMQSLQLELNAGLVSKETAATQRGRDWEEERAKIDQEAAAGMAMQQQAMQQMGAAPVGSQAQPGQAGGDNGKQQNQGMMGSSGNAGKM
jgi:hypothetical protein